MKLIIYAALMSCLACSKQPTEKEPIAKEEKSNSIIQYPEKKLIGFLDSIGRLNPQRWVEKFSDFTDSTLNGQTDLSFKLSSADFKKLKAASQEGEIETRIAKRIFPNLKADTTYYTQSIEYYSLNSEANFEEFAILIGNPDLSWENEVYFFKKNEVISRHYVYHRNGFELNHFKNENNETVIYYVITYDSGSGIWWHQYNFFKYEAGKLVPMLSEIKNVNLTYPWGWRSYWIESSIVNERPLQIKFVYNNGFFDIDSDTTVELSNDSSIVTYSIDQTERKYKANFKDEKLNKNKLLSYYILRSEFLFVNTHYDLLKEAVNGKDTTKRKAVLGYLNGVKNMVDGRY